MSGRAADITATTEFDPEGDISGVEIPQRSSFFAYCSSLFAY